jgi:hypothetical protein
MRARSCARELLAEAPAGSRDAEVRDARVFRAVLRKRCLPQLERVCELAERYPGNAHLHAKKRRHFLPKGVLGVDQSDRPDEVDALSPAQSWRRRLAALGVAKIELSQNRVTFVPKNR